MDILYCKACAAEALRAGPDWPADAPDAEYFFVHGDGVVTVGADRQDGPVIGTPSDRWLGYCRDTLGMPVPDVDGLSPQEQSR
ncbi:hypothetical protein [Nitrospirillum amazonense]|uniref:hypothetical protein n=1 Tax=Nitrospirillum amazonense TaxID=28077 RepID=UPI001646E4BA|nr:hypothetical protein [Nitrospirillum amazonense]